MPKNKKNAIEERLEIIEGLWNEFAQDPSARLCRWLVDADEARMIEAFVELQNEEVGTVPDLFVRFDNPFVDSKRHGFTLCESLNKKYEEIREEIQVEGVPSDWRCPAPDAIDTNTFVRSLESLQKKYSNILTQVVAVLLPDFNSNSVLWEEWLAGVIQSNVSANVRILVLDSAEKPSLEDLAKAQPVKLKTIKPELDMPGAYLELARGTGKLEPGVSFRLHFVSLTQAAAKGDLDKAGRHAASALAIAQEHGWLQMQVTVYMALAATQLGAKKPDEAVASYRTAGSIARAAVEQGDPVASKLVLQSKLGEGAALFSDARYAEAAVVYEAAAVIAQPIPEYMMCMESWRMASYCHEQDKKLGESFRCGFAALDTAEKLDPQIRANSTLPYVGQGLLRLVKPRGRIFRFRSREEEDREEQVRARMVRLVGAEWEEKLQTKKA